MPHSDEESRDLVSRPTGGERLAEAVGALTSAVPGLGGPVSAVVSGVVTQRKIDRVAEVLEDLTVALEGFESDRSQEYIQTEEFEDLLEETLSRVARERAGDKRELYKRFLAHAIRMPGEPYDEQIRHLRTLERIQPAHVEVLAAILQEPNPDTSVWAGSPSQTLAERLQDETQERYEGLVEDLNELRVTNFTSLKTMMTGHGAQDLRHNITDYGTRFVAYLLEDD